MTYDVTFVELPEQHTAVRRGHVSHTGIAEFLGGAFGAVGAALGAAHLEPAGPPFAKYVLHEDGSWDIQAGFPVTDPIEGNGDVEPGILPGGSVAQTVHEGDYAELRSAYEAIQDFVTAGGMRVGEDSWESYLDDPMTAEAPRTLVTMSVLS
jgi:effector-binding domain-containing protein